MNQPNPTNQFVDDEINLRDYWRVLVRRRALILGLTFGAAILTAVFVLLQPNVYQSQAVLMPLGKASSGLQGALGDLSAWLPVNLGVTTESPADRIVAILKSRTLAEDVIQQLDLLPRLFADVWDPKSKQWQTDEPPTLYDAVRTLEGIASVNSDTKTGVITIAVEHTDPELAATIANQYVEVLQQRLNQSAFSLAKKNRLFIETQLQKTRQSLVVAEEALRQFEQQYEIIALDAQAQAAVEALASLESQIRAKEVQLAVLQRTVTGASQEVTLLQEELQELRAQLVNLQGRPSVTPHAPKKEARVARSFPSFEDTPEIKLQYARLQREAQIQNKLFGLLTQQLEQAKISEAQDETAFQVLDQAIPPDRKSKPRRTMSVILAMFVGGFLGVFTAFFREYMDPTVRSREQIEQQMGLSLLASIPLPASPQRRSRRRAPVAQGAALVLSYPIDDPLVEAYRYLHTRLQHSRDGRGVHTVLFTSPGPEDAAASIAAVNLAIVAARAGEKTLLIDVNARAPGLHRLLHCPPAPGLTDIRTDPEGWQKVIQTTSVDNLYFLPAGTGSAATFTYLEPPVFDALLVRCKEAYNLILCVAPPVLGLSAAAVLGSKVEGTCLVLSSGVSNLETAMDAKTALEAVQANIIGALFVNSPGKPTN